MTPDQFDQLITVMEGIRNAIGFNLAGIIVTLGALLLLLAATRK